MAPRMAEVAQRIVAWDEVTKGTRNYEIYDPYFADFTDRAVTLLELGVYRGESTKVFATYFKNGKVIGVDVEDRNIDFSGYPNVAFERADQRDVDRLKDICARHAPNGIDIVIDDAAHIGAWSLMSYRILLPFLNPGGLYVIEDWGTGYWDDWPDGQRLRAPARRLFRWRTKRRIPSHDSGMVGFVKSVFEDVSIDISPIRGAPKTRTPQLEFMHLYGNLAILKKLSAR